MANSILKLALLILVSLCSIGNVSADMNITTFVEFLANDTTDEHEYLPWYTCGHFSRDLAKNGTIDNLSIGSAILGNHPRFAGCNNHVINYVYINDTIIFIEPQTDQLLTLDEVFFSWWYIRLYPDGTQVPTNWNCNLAYTLSYDDPV